LVAVADLPMFKMEEERGVEVGGKREEKGERRR